MTMHPNDKTGCIVLGMILTFILVISFMSEFFERRPCDVNARELMQLGMDSAIASYLQNEICSKRNSEK